MKGYHSRANRRNGHKPQVRQPVDPGNKLDIQRTLVFALAYTAEHMGQGAADQLLGLTGNPGLRADVDAIKNLIVRLAAVMSGNGNMRQAMYPFTIGDVNDHTKPHTFGVVRYGGVGLGISIDGYGENTAQAGAGQPVWVEIVDGIPYVKIWGDINNEDATHTISLEGAAESLRIPDEQGEDDGQEQEPQETPGEDAGVSSSSDELEAQS